MYVYTMTAFSLCDEVKPRWVGVYGLDGDSDRIVSVVAKTITPVSINYECPFCNRNHRHGSAGEVHNRIESRVAHCNMVAHDVNIHITNNTIRCREKRFRWFINQT